jgi:hypothetical protein
VSSYIEAISRIRGDGTKEVAMKTTVRALVAALAITTLSAPAFAHHNANAQWQTDKRLELTGTLKEVRDMAPHSQWAFDVRDASGKVNTWHFEAVQNAALRRQGIIVKQQIKPGTTYKLVYSPSRDGSNSGFLIAIYIDGKRVDFVRL